MASHRITAIESEKPARTAGHRVIVAVEIAEADGPRRWTVKRVLDAMNSAERFYTQGANGRQARVQRYRCGACGVDHIRTHVSDTAIHELSTLERQRQPAPQPPLREGGADETAARVRARPGTPPPA